MSEKDINKEAFKQAEKELLESKVNEVKGYMLETLNKIEEKKKMKERIEEELRILKLDLDDLRSGDFKNIEERKMKSMVAKDVSVVMTDSLVKDGSYSIMTSTGLVNYNTFWNNATGGTYTTTSKIYYF